MPCLLKTLSLPWLEKEDICCFSLILISTENEGVNLHYLFIIVAHYLLYFVERRKLSTEAWQTTCYKKLSLSCHSECDLLKCPHCLHQPWSSQRGSYIEKVPAVFNKIANCKKKKKKTIKKLNFLGRARQPLLVELICSGVVKVITNSLSLMSTN